MDEFFVRFLVGFENGWDDKSYIQEMIYGGKVRSGGEEERRRKSTG